ncbi:MAG: C69 family dipeptidase [Ichthyobacteriaceae bacterium]|nr:C69 family dipeptidase [Ichthyobacteriaceae bacterium]
MLKINTIHKLIIAILLLVSIKSEACTNILVTKGASTDESTMITYAADAHVMYGELYYWPATDWQKGDMRKVYEWDTNKYLGEITQPKHTYGVIGNMNEFQLAIGETTFTGRTELKDSTGIIDYGSLIYITLQRAKNAREAIKVMTDLVNEYGYYSTGESFSIADTEEVWILEMISKGTYEKGAVWVARKIPDGYISGHANQARITTFPQSGKTAISSKKMGKKLFDKRIETIYSHDVISFAKKMKYFDGKDKDFDFSAAYAPIDFGGARFCDARVYSVFRKVDSSIEKYEEYAMGDITKERMPLWIKPKNKLSVKDVMELMRDHYEDTPMDMTADLGAGPSKLPYRWRRLTWKHKDANGVEQKYFNERAISTQQTGFSFVSQSRGWLPNAIGGLIWFGVDDTYSTVYTPIYTSSTKTPNSFAVGNGSMTEYSATSAFWIFNQVSNFAYMRYDLIIEDVRKKQFELEAKYIETITEIDKKAVALYNSDKKSGIDYVTNFSVNNADEMVADWKNFSNYLLVKYMDGNVKNEENGKFKRNKHNYPASPQYPGYSDEWKDEVIKQTGDKFLMPKGGH